MQYMVFPPILGGGEWRMRMQVIRWFHALVHVVFGHVKIELLPAYKALALLGG